MSVNSLKYFIISVTLTTLFVSELFAFSQTKYDSLISVLNTSPDDTSKIKIYTELSKQLSYSENKKALEYTYMALEIAKQISSKSKEALCYELLGETYKVSGNESKSIKYFNYSIDLYEKIGKLKNAADIYTKLGIAFYRFDKYDSAIIAFNKALAINTKLNDEKGKAINLNRIGLAETALGNFEKAIEYHLKALKINEEINDLQAIADLNNNIGNVYNTMGNNEKALQYYLRTIEIREKMGEKQQIIATLINIASIYSDIYDFKNAIKNYNKALEYVNENTNKQWVVNLHINLGNTYSDMKDFDQAIENLTIALKLADKYNYKVSKSICRLNIGTIYYNQNNYKRALDEVLKGLSIAEQSNVKPLISEFYYTLSRIYDTIANYKKSYYYLKLYSEISDSVFNSETTRQIAELQTKYESEKKEKAIKLLQADNRIKDLILKNKKNERNFFIIGFMFILLIFSVIYNRYRIKIKTNKLLIAKSDKIQRINTELTDRNLIISKQNAELEKYTNEQKKLLATKDKFFSIIAHDLKSPFNAIIGLSNMVFYQYDKFDESSLLDFVKRINTSSQEVFKLLENLLNWSRAQTGKIDFNPEVFNIKQAALEAVSFSKSIVGNKNISISVTCDDNIFVFADKNMINTVFRNLISNAIKFTETGGRIEIIVNIMNKYAKVSIKDNGIGISKENIKKLFRVEDKFQTAGTQNEKGTGLGLILCKEFIEINKGKIKVESEIGKGSTFIFTIPTEIN